MVMVSYGSTGTKITFEENSLLKCPPNKEGVYYVVQFGKGNAEIHYNNCTSCMLSQHTMFHMDGVLFKCSHNSISHNALGILYRIISQSGTVTQSNHVNNQIMGTEWSVSHDFSGAVVTYSQCVFVDIPHRKFSWESKSTYSNCVIYNCGFGSNSVFSRPTEYPIQFFGTGQCVANLPSSNHIESHRIKFIAYFLVFIR